VKNFLGHAIAATEIAAISHADAQVMKGALELIFQWGAGLQPRWRWQVQAAAPVHHRNDSF
jgi:hypothetical protein